MQGEGRDARAACAGLKKVLPSFSSPNSLNPPCEQLIHLYTSRCSAQRGRGQLLLQPGPAQGVYAPGSGPCPPLLPWIRVLVQRPREFPTLTPNMHAACDGDPGVPLLSSAVASRDTQMHLHHAKDNGSCSRWASPAQDWGPAG